MRGSLSSRVQVDGLTHQRRERRVVELVVFTEVEGPPWFASWS